MLDLPTSRLAQMSMLPISCSRAKLWSCAVGIPKREQAVGDDRHFRVLYGGQYARADKRDRVHHACAPASPEQRVMIDKANRAITCREIELQHRLRDGQVCARKYCVVSFLAVQSRRWLT